MTSRKAKIEPYPIERSPFWRLGTQRDLAALLVISKTQLRKLILEREFHYFTRTDIINGKRRMIACPREPLRSVHERLKELFDRIQQREYIYSPRRGVSAVMNASVHRNSRQLFKLDIRQFYPSTTREHVFRFFFHHLHMNDDVAGALAKLATFEGHLPFGSPLSPILCSFVHRDMFDQIAAECSLKGNVLSVWVDDLTVSGDQITERLIYQMKTKIEAKGFQTHKEYRRLVRKGVVVTGGYLSQKGIAPANKTHLKIRTKMLELDSTREAEKRLPLVNSLVGLTNHVRHMTDAGSPIRKRADGRRQWLHNERRKLQNEIAQSAQSSGPAALSSETPREDTVPWR